MEFRTWLEEKEKKEKNREGIGSKILALGIPMASAIGGAALGGATLGPAGILPGWLLAKKAATNYVQDRYPVSTTDLMKKK